MRQLSEDGRWWWDGQAWQPVDGARQGLPGWSPAAPVAPTSRYGGFWIRAVAMMIDSAILAVPGLFLAVLLFSSIAGANSSDGRRSGAFIGAFLLLVLAWMALGFGYFIFFWSRGQTPGMRLFRLYVVDAETGQRISPGRAALRMLGFMAARAFFDLGLIWVAFDSRKQGWHDKIAHTYVIQY